MLKKLLAFLSACGFFISWFSKETIKAWFFDGVVHVITPTEANLIDWGIPAAFAVLCIGLLIWRSPPKADTAMIHPADRPSTPTPVSAEPYTQSPFTEFMSLQKAATELYEYARVHVPLFAHAAEHPIGGRPASSDDILNFFGVYIAQTKNIPLHGKRPPATTFVLIADEEVRRSLVADGATALRDKIYDHVLFTELAIKASAVPELISKCFGKGSEQLAPASVDEYVLLHNAAALAYGELRISKSAWVKLIDDSSKTPDEKLDWTARYAAGDDFQVYGKVPPATVLEPIKGFDWKVGRLYGGASYLRHGKVTYTELSAKKVEWDAEIERLKRFKEDTKI